MDNRHYAVIAEFTRSSLGAVQLLLVAKALGASLFGTYSLVFAAAILLSPLVLLGCTNWIQPYLQKSGDQQGARTHVVLSVIGVLAFWGPLAAIGLTFFTDADGWAVFVLLCAELGVFTGWTHLALVELGMQRGFQYCAWVAAISVTRLLAAALLFLQPRPSMEFFAWSLLVVGSIGMALQLTWARWRPSVSPKALKANRHRILSFSLVSILSSTLDQADKVILGRFLPGSQFGTYSAASRLNMYTLIPARGVAQAVYPKYFAAAENADRTVLRRLMRRTSFLGVITTFLLGSAVVGLIAWLGTSLLPGYHGLALICAALMPRLLLRPITYALGDALYAFDRGVIRLASLAIVAVTYVMGLALVAPRGRIWEIAAVGFVAEGLNLMLFWVALRRTHRVAPVPEIVPLSTTTGER